MFNTLPQVLGYGMSHNNLHNFIRQKRDNEYGQDRRIVAGPSLDNKIDNNGTTIRSLNIRNLAWKGGIDVSIDIMTTEKRNKVSFPE